MKRLLLCLVLVPVLAQAQKKSKKQRKAEEKAAAVLVSNLTSHVKFLASDELEGRRTGTRGEQLAMEYIIAEYTKAGLEPKGSNGFIQEFEINEGKAIDDKTQLTINNKPLVVNKEFFPLAYSAQKSVAGSVAVAMNEPRQPWFKDLKDIAEENKTNPHFDIDDYIQKEATRVAGKGATALVLYNTSDVVDNVQYNKNDKTQPLAIPVLYITKDGFKKHCSDATATVPVKLNVSITERKRTAHNVIAYIDNHAANTVILGAHFDHLGYGEDKNALDTAHTVHNGADDNASGTAALIELAKMLKQQSPKNNNYLIMHFSGEELGLFGSKYWVEHPTTKITANYMINMDMVGRYDTAHKLTIGGFGTSPVWQPVLSAVNTTLITKYDSTGSGPSDHATFYRADIPVLFFFTGSHADYHKATDDWDKINYNGEKDIVQYIYQVITLADDKGKLPFAKTTEPQIGRVKMTVTLGVIPDYGYTGTGMRIDGVSPGKLAEKIGLQAGDVLLQLGEYKFVDVMSYMQALGKFKKGDKTTLRVKRGDAEKEYNIEL